MQVKKNNGFWFISGVCRGIVRGFYPISERTEQTIQLVLIRSFRGEVFHFVWVRLRVIKLDGRNLAAFCQHPLSTIERTSERCVPTWEIAVYKQFLPRDRFDQASSELAKKYDIRPDVQ